MMKKFTKNSRGFTLIELLVVIAIIGILSAIVLASLATARSKGKDAATEEQMSGARSQMELYAEANSNNYTGGCVAAATSGLGGTSPYTGIIGGILADAPSGDTFVPNNATLQTATQIECNDSTNSAWALSVPLNTAIGTNAYWCVDSAGDSKADTALTALTGGKTVCN